MATSVQPPRKGHLYWGRSHIIFVIAWLIRLYVYEVAAGHYGQGVGIGLAILTLAVSAFARSRSVTAFSNHLRVSVMQPADEDVRPRGVRFQAKAQGLDRVILSDEACGRHHTASTPHQRLRGARQCSTRICRVSKTTCGPSTRRSE
jgi:hypothetical protein